MNDIQLQSMRKDQILDTDDTTTVNVSLLQARSKLPVLYFMGKATLHLHGLYLQLHYIFMVCNYTDQHSH